MSSNRLIKLCRQISGEVRVPGDKSISHRAALFSALADGASHISGFLSGEDCLSTLSVLERLGVKSQVRGTDVIVHGVSGRFQKPDKVLDCGNSGTTMRLMAGLLAGAPFTSVMTGDDSLRSRPMKRIRDPLEKMGARIELTGDKGTAPITIHGGSLKPVTYSLPMASAQVKSCVLLAGLYADGETVVIEPEETRDHTERMLAALGAEIRVDGRRISIRGRGTKGLGLKARDWSVPGDISSAAFWIVAAACRKGSKVCIRGVGLNPRRTALLDVLRRMGADIDVAPAPVSGQDEPVGDITVRGGSLRATEIGGKEIPNLIDEIPILCVAGAMAQGRTVIRDAGELRVKETDRIQAMVDSLQAMGVKADAVGNDGMVVEGTKNITGGAKVESHGDHRIAMSMSILGLFARDGVEVRNVDCVSTSYPGFWDHLALLSGGTK